MLCFVVLLNKIFTCSHPVAIVNVRNLIFFITNTDGIHKKYMHYIYENRKTPQVTTETYCLSYAAELIGTVFHSFDLELLTQFPAPNDEK